MTGVQTCALPIWFDEQANVTWARKLEDAGVHVVYGLVGFKTHAKLSLVVREEGNGIRRYVHVGTGNYNPKTARIYEDFGLLSADPVLGEDVNRLFNQLSGFAPQTTFNRLLVAPRTIRQGLLDKIQNEILCINLLKFLKKSILLYYYIYDNTYCKYSQFK